MRVRLKQVAAFGGHKVMMHHLWKKADILKLPGFWTEFIRV